MVSILVSDVCFKQNQKFMYLPSLQIKPTSNLKITPLTATRSLFVGSSHSSKFVIKALVRIDTKGDRGGGKQPSRNFFRYVSAIVGFVLATLGVETLKEITVERLKDPVVSLIRLGIYGIGLASYTYSFDPNTKNVLVSGIAQHSLDARVFGVIFALFLVVLLWDRTRSP